MELNKIYNQDCIEYMKTLPNGCVDLIIADPPYYEICGGFDFVFKSKEQYIEWCQQWILECRRILKSNGTLIVWGAIGFNKGMCFPQIAVWLESTSYFHVKDWVTQRNSRGRGTKRGYMSSREEFLFLTKDEIDYTWNTAYTDEKSNRKDLGADGKPRKNEFKRCSNVWCDISEASQSSKERFKLSDGSNFPTVKALKICNRLIKAHSNEGELIYIPFAGSGSEIVSCIKNNRNWIATETNKEYIDEIINKRIKNTYEELSEKVS